MAPLTGKLYKIVTDGEESEEVFVCNIAQKFGSDYKTEKLQGSIDEVGIYKAEFWGNPRYSGEEEVSGDLYHFVFRFEIVDKDTPQEPSINEAYLNGLIGFSDLQSKYYSVALQTKGAGKAIFAFSDFGGAYDFAYETERGKVQIDKNKYTYNGRDYATQSAVLNAVDKAAKELVVVRYFDSTNPKSYQTADIADENVLNLNFAEDIIVFSNDAEQSYMHTELPSLNGRKYRYVSPDTGEIQEGVLYFSFLKVAGFESNSVSLTHKETGVVYSDIQFGVSVEYQLGLKNAPSGVYTVREQNAFGSYSEYDVSYIKPGDMTGSLTVSLFRNGSLNDKVFNKSNCVTESNLNGFILKSANNGIDPYSIVKITHNGKADIYAFEEIENIYFADGGVYDFVLADRLGNTVSFSLIITSPVGFADIHLELEQEDSSIITDYHVFVGQEIELPIPTLTNELFVFDGWLYDDVLITDGKFTPTVGGTLYVWQQITQKYTYINFDSNGGGIVEKIKAEIGVPVELPVPTKDGWSFGGWEYVGNIYEGSYVPTTASPTFVAVWNFIETEIKLYDGNIYQNITAHVGDKVLLPFPSRTGYTFFGWREALSDGSNKVYYGQITELANVETLNLYALWIRETSVDVDSLSNGTGGRIMVHFVDGALLQNDSLQGAAGTSVALPKPTRAGFTFAGWVWRTTSTSGKIYSSDFMEIPATSDGKIILEALWTAKSTGNGAVSAVLDGVGGNSSVIGNSVGAKCALLGLGFVALLFCACFVLSAHKAKRAVHRRVRGIALSQTIIPCAQGSADSTGRTSVKYRRKRLSFNFKFNLGLATVCIALIMAAIMSFTALFSGWEIFGGFKGLADYNNTPVSNAQTARYEFGEDEVGGNLKFEAQPTKTEVLENFDAIESDFELDLTEEELFLYSLIMLDLYSLGYNVFAAQADLPNGEKILGLAYSDYEEIYSIENSDKVLNISSGFVSLPAQALITKADIEMGVTISDANLSLEVNEFKDYNYILSIFEKFGPCHYVADGKYVVYSVDGTLVNYTSVPANENVFNAEYGSVYSYDEGRIVFDPDLGKKVDFKSTSLNTMLDPAIAKGEYEKYVTEQTANGFTVDTLNFVYISYDSLSAYYLSQQDESLLGIDVQEFYEMERTVGPNEYYTVDEDGNLTKLEFPPKVEDKASWLDRLAGAILSIGMICVGVIIVAAISVVSCGAATAAAPYIMGAFIGAGMEIFMQTVIQGNKIKDINWLRVGIAAVSGAVAAIPGLGWLGAGLVQGATEAAMTLADGGSLADVLTSFAVGFATGVVIHGVGKALSKIKFCFVAGTAVLMAGGYTKAIENIRVGDMVKSYNPITGKVQNKRVLQTFENETYELTTVTTTDGQKVVSTPGHKFFANNAWVSA
ncbi:MAG: InlB B-repeat-containing protein, partial [Clostridia bacterium]|nr:InlB B-repeat-containing protein [Clostridia bacterium]